MEEETHDAAFDKIMEIVGNSGKFQKRFNYIFIIGLEIAATMMFMNVILAVNVPEHWCYVPGRENTNLTIEEWKNLTLPINPETKSYESCKMYNVSDVQASSYNEWNFGEPNVVACQYGHEFDKTWYESTAVSDGDWVCERDIYQTNVFVFIRIGETVGTLFLGQIGDTYGRQIIYYISVLILLIFRPITIVLVPWYIAFLTVTVMGSLSGMQVFQTPLIISMEISKPDDRAGLAMYQSLAWSAAMCSLPLLFWWLRNWKIFLFVTSIPLALFLCFPKYMIESPRWLINKKKFAKSAKVLQRIANINEINVEITEKKLRKMLPEGKAEEVYGVASLFTSRRLAQNTILLIMCWCVCTLSYFSLILYIAQLPGNPFLNFLGQSVVDVPSFVIGQYFSNKIGRRLTNTLSFWIAGIICIPTILIANSDDYRIPFICLTVVLKLCVTVTFFAVNLQSMETYPTSLRQTGTSFGAVVSNVVGIGGPYIVYLGTHFDRRYPYAVLLILFIIGGICGLFLPETLHYKLPDSLEEAKVFGKDQIFWGIPKPQEKKDDEIFEEEMLNLQHAG